MAGEVSDQLTQERVPLERISTQPLRDYSSFWEMPVAPENMPMVLQTKKNEPAATHALGGALT